VRARTARSARRPATAAPARPSPSSTARPCRSVRQGGGHGIRHRRAVDTPRPATRATISSDPGRRPPARRGPALRSAGSSGVCSWSVYMPPFASDRTTVCCIVQTPPGLWATRTEAFHRLHTTSKTNRSYGGHAESPSGIERGVSLVLGISAARALASASDVAAGHVRRAGL
jgi:hypothetical protein